MKEADRERDIRKVTVSLPGDLNYLDIARAFVADVAAKVGLTSAEIHDLQLVVTEAITNVIEHAFTGQEEGHGVELAIEKEGQCFVVAITDHGQNKFTPDHHLDPNMKEYLSECRVGGLGLFLMRKLMDEVEFKSDQSSNTLRLVKRLKD